MYIRIVLVNVFVALLLQREIARLQETHEADLHHLRTQQTLRNQQLTIELREKDVRMREMAESHRRREEELLTQLQQKDVEKNGEIGRLRRNADINRNSTGPQV